MMGKIEIGKIGKAFKHFRAYLYLYSFQSIEYLAQAGALFMPRSKTAR